jgi:hypothetical protein
MRLLPVLKRTTEKKDSDVRVVNVLTPRPLSLHLSTNTPTGIIIRPFHDDPQ